MLPEDAGAVHKTALLSGSLEKGPPITGGPLTSQAAQCELRTCAHMDGRTGLLKKRKSARTRAISHDTRCQPYIDVSFIITAQRRLMTIEMRRYYDDKSEATAIDYALLAASIALVVISVVNGLGIRLNSRFTSINGLL